MLSILNNFNKFKRISFPTQTYLLVKFISDAQRTEKSSNFICWKQTHPLWWCVSALFVLQENSTQDETWKIYFLQPTQQSIQYFRGTFSTHIPNNTWSWSYRNIASSQTQWCLSISHRLTNLSKSDNAPTFSFSISSRSTAQAQSFS